MIDEASKFNATVYLGGAEPLLRRDFFRILEHIKARGLPVSFTTNGTLFDPEKIAEIVRLRIDQVIFSVDGVEHLHDDIRGEGAYQRTILAIKELSACRKRSGGRRPSVHINMTVSDALVTRLRETIGAVMEATDDGVDFYRIHHLWFVTPSELSAHQTATKRFLGCSSPGAASHVIPGSRLVDARALAEAIRSLQGWPKVQSFPALAYDGILKYYDEGKDSDQRCIAPFIGVVIKPNGDVKFCPDEWIDDYVLGNIRHDSLEEIWNNARARKFRSALFRETCFPACKRCSFMYSLRDL